MNEELVVGRIELNNNLPVSTKDRNRIFVVKKSLPTSDVDERDAQIAELKRMNDILVSIVNKLCIELRKENTISARRKQAKDQYEKMQKALGRSE